ncbi:MAG: PilZ domain-containing protein [Terracidiphilus sp.]
MDEAENPIGLAADRCEHREMPRCAVDVPATLVVLSHGTMIVGRMTELSLSGCRVLLPRTPLHAPNVLIECTFRIRGVGFRLGGVIEWAENNLVGVRFSAMSSRSRDDLMEVLCEVEVENGATAPPAELLQRVSPVLKPPRPSVPLAVPGPVFNHPAARHKGRDRRAAHRCGIDTSAVIDLVKVGSKLSGKIVDLSLGGCRIRTAEKFPVGIYTRIEAEFQLHGLPFRLGGVIQAIHDRNTVGIRFLDMSPRKKDQVAELVAEMEESQGG